MDEEEKGTEQEPFLYRPAPDYLITSHVLIEGSKKGLALVIMC